jgi:hypothetical protein
VGHLADAAGRAAADTAGSTGDALGAWHGGGDGAVTWQALGIYWGLSLAGWVALTAGAVWAMGREKVSDTFFGRGWGAAGVVVGVAAALRIGVWVATPMPGLSDDIWRYVFDGQTVSAGHNPYAVVPAKVGGKAVKRINHPHLVTIYQPVSQWAFAGLASAGAQQRGFRLASAGADVIVVLLLVVWLRRCGRSAWWAAVYGWHPLAISESAWAGHQEPLGLTLLVAAVGVGVFGVRGAGLAGEERGLTPTAQRDTAGRRALVGVVCGGLLGAAVAVKPVVLLAAVPLARRLGAVGTLSAMIGGALAGLVAYGPFLAMDGGLHGMVVTGRSFVGAWSFNGLVYEAVRGLNLDHAEASPLLGVLLVGGVLVATARLGTVASVAAVMGWSLLVSSTVHPWYLLWALVWLPLLMSEAAAVSLSEPGSMSPDLAVPASAGPGRGGTSRKRFLTPFYGLPAWIVGLWMWSLTIGWAYAAHGVAGYHVPAAVLGAEYGAVAAAAAGWRWWVWRSGRATAAGG